MQVSRRDLIDEFVGLVGEPGDDRVRTLAERALNASLERVFLKGVSWRTLTLPTPHLITTVAQQRTYALPSYFGRVSSKDGVVRNVTMPREIRPVDREVLGAADVRQGTSNEQAAAPRCYYIDGTWGVHTQPAAAGEALEVLSDSTDDTTVRVFLEGLNQNGEWTQTQVTLNGTTPVALGQWAFVQQLGKSYPENLDAPALFQSSAGTVTLRTTGATVLQTLGPFDAAKDHELITFYPVPDAAYEIAVPIMRSPRPMVLDADPCPKFWKPALIEDMLIYWNNRNVPNDPNAPRPALADLIAHEVLSQPPQRTRPFLGG